MVCVEESGEVCWKGGGEVWVAVGDVSNEVDILSEGEDAARVRRRRRGDEDGIVGLVLVVLVDKVLSV
jgi:hypothetical protein